MLSEPEYRLVERFALETNDDEIVLNLVHLPLDAQTNLRKFIGSRIQVDGKPMRHSYMVTKFVPESNPSA
ncbi:MAG: hypothetical protein SFX74_09220 [Fimbriimonadaceae bacterium]|nr:hypothetical protein [Fimbriimonadaceae bacterium]